MPIAYVGFGSNIGDKAGNIHRALDILSQIDSIKVTKVSSFYETEPIGYEDQDWFINAVVQIETILTPEELLSAFKKVEQIMGRKNMIRWGPREIDLDLLMYDQLCFESPGLVIPHPRLHERAFVLIPLAEIAPDLVHPIQKKTIAELQAGIQSKKTVKKGVQND
jgi:2-amino-4-hydroxy-6-hydroxymethyldihydropteridine diphosphokinase